MTSFRDVPINDIEYLLNKYKQNKTGDKYLTAWNFLIQNDNILVPKSIADWVINYNNLQIFEDLNQFNNLPEELIIKLLIDLDVKSLTYFCNSNTKNKIFCDKNIKNIYLEKLSKITKLDLNKYSFSNLLQIYKSGLLEDNKIILFDEKAYVIKNNKLKTYSNTGQSLPKTLRSCYKIVPENNNKINILDVAGNLYSLSNFDNEYYLNKMDTPTNFKDISRKYDRALGIDDEGNVFVDRESSLLTNGVLRTTNNDNEFIDIPELKNIVQISSGVNHSLMLDNNGKVFSFGNSALGYPSITRHIVTNANTIQVSSLMFPPREIPDLNNIVKVSAGTNHSLYLDSFGKVYSSGDNKDGQLGIPGNKGKIIKPTLIKDVNNIVDILADEYQSYFLTKDGIVYACGFLHSLLIENKNRRYVHYFKPVKILDSENTIKVVANNQILGLVKNDTNIYILNPERTRDVLTIEDFYKLTKPHPKWF